jgi:hypothetical protein
MQIGPTFEIVLSIFLSSHFCQRYLPSSLSGQVVLQATASQAGALVLLV